MLLGVNIIKIVAEAIAMALSLIMSTSGIISTIVATITNIVGSNGEITITKIAIKAAVSLGAIILAGVITDIK